MQGLYQETAIWTRIPKDCSSWVPQTVCGGKATEEELWLVQSPA